MSSRSLASVTSLLALLLAPATLAQTAEPDPGPPDASWLQQVRKQIAAEEYEVTWQTRTVLPDLDAAWHAPNRAQGFRIYFTEEGIRVVPRDYAGPDPDGGGAAPPWEWRLELAGYGRGGEMRTVAAPRLGPSGSRIDYDRGSISEWYANGPRGLEQGFTLWSAPEEIASAEAAVTPPRGPRSAPVTEKERARLVHLDLRLGGSLTPSISTDGRAVDFRTGRGANVVHYAELVVTDAGGKALPAWIEGFSGEGFGGLRLVFDDANAAYPVTVDPLATSASWTGEGNQASAGFGLSVSTAGDVDGDGYSDVVVGAYAYDNGEADEGRAYVYLGSASGLAATAAWTAESDQTGAWFGRSVSTAGDVNGDGYADVIVGAHLYDNGEADEGRAYVYHGSASGLSTTPAWTAESDQAGADFGYALATAGDVNGDGYADVIVGARHFDNGQGDEGRAFVYHGSASGLAATAAWTAESDQTAAVFGRSVATAGDINGDGYADVIVGARYYDNGEFDEGRAYVYHGSASGLSSTAAWITESDQDSAYFGYSVSTAGDVNGDGYADVIVGAVFYDNGETDEGRAYVYLGSASGLSSTAAWTAESDQIGARFGTSVSTAGDVNGDGYADVIVGADGYDNVETGEGRAFVYHGSASGLGATAAWTAESDQDQAYFGICVATAGDVNGDGYADVIVGAYKYDNGETDEGRAYVYHGSAAGLAATPGWTAESDENSAQFGLSVARAGDANGDGYADVIVGAPGFDNGQTDEGRAYVFRGSASGLAASPSWTAESDQAGADFGFAVATAGDVNGDGYADVIVGAHGYDNGETDEGRAYVYNGSAAGLAAAPAWTAESDQASARFGYSAATAGDVNGDGYTDIIVGAWVYDNGETDEGRAYVYQGSASGLAASPSWTGESDQPAAYFGAAVGTAGDVNGDGYADVIVGAYKYDNGETDEGRAFVYHGSASGLAASPAWTADSNQPSAVFGISVATAGDVNGDGYADVIVGAKYFDNGQNDEGRAYLYQGSASGLAASPSWTAESDQGSAHFGESVGTAGDVNGDGYADVIVGVPRYSNGQTYEGRAYVYHGSASGLAASPNWTAESDQASAYFGWSVGTAGDVNGDGYADVIVGARYFDNGETDEGRAFLYYGNDGPGLSLRPEQRRADDSVPIAKEGTSRSPDGFRLTATGRSPFGRTKVRLEWEVKARGKFLDGTDTSTGTSWLDTGTSGVDFDELVSGLEPGDYHWRVRLLYDPATSPFAQASRWFTIPWGGQEEADLSVASFIGGAVWEDRDGDGIRRTPEPMLGGIEVDLLDDLGTTVQIAYTASDGSYHFEVDASSTYTVRFIKPSGYGFTLQDQGTDDTLDSDADTVTGETVAIAPPFMRFDDGAWSAGLRKVGPCSPPTESVYIYQERLSTDGNDYPILDFQDPNQPGNVTGYNVYRSSDAGVPFDQWPLVGYDVVDMDEATPNIQWVDDSGDTSPSGTWYYQIIAYNDPCGAEGPR